MSTLTHLAPLCVLVTIWSIGCEWRMAPDHFEDMHDVFASLEVPSNFILVSEERSGLRDNFTSAPPPSIVRTFSAPFDPAVLCEELPQAFPVIAKDQSPFERESCRLEGSVDAGPDAKRSGVDRYRIAVYAFTPELDECTALALPIRPAGRGVSLLPRRSAVCPARTEDALVRIHLIGKKGW